MGSFLVELHCKTDQFCLELLQNKSDSLLRLSESFRLRVVTPSERAKLPLKQRTEEGNQPKAVLIPDSKDIEYRQLKTSQASATYFQPQKYFQNLYSRYLGHLLAYSPEVSSTQDVARSLCESLNWKNMVVVADTQIKGRGRRTNQWQTELGSLAFSTVCSYSLYSDSDASIVKRNIQVLPWRNVSFIQYLVALAIVEVIKGGKFDVEPFFCM